MSASVSSARRVATVTSSHSREQLLQLVVRFIHCASESQIAGHVKDRLVRVGAEEHFGWNLMRAQKPLEGRQVSGAIRRIAERGFPDRVETGQNHLCELVDVVLPRT